MTAPRYGATQVPRNSSIVVGTLNGDCEALPDIRTVPWIDGTVEDRPSLDGATCTRTFKPTELLEPHTDYEIWTWWLESEFRTNAQIDVVPPAVPPLPDIRLESEDYGSCGWHLCATWEFTPEELGAPEGSVLEVEVTRRKDGERSSFEAVVGTDWYWSYDTTWFWLGSCTCLWNYPVGPRETLDLRFRQRDLSGRRSAWSSTLEVVFPEGGPDDTLDPEDTEEQPEREARRCGCDSTTRATWAALATAALDTVRRRRPLLGR